MKKLTLLLAIVLFSSSLLIAQNTTNKEFIEVTGKAEKEVVPDEIYIDIQLKERVEKGKKLSLDYLESELKRELKAIGIPQENLFIGDINAILAKTGWWKEELLSIAKYNLKVTNATKMKLLFERFKILKIRNVNIVKATHSKIKKLEKENRIAAIKNAKEKATYLLNAIDATVGIPLYVRENNVNIYQPRMSSMNSYKVKRMASMESIDIATPKVVQFEKIKLTSSVYVKFEIK